MNERLTSEQVWTDAYERLMAGTLPIATSQIGRWIDGVLVFEPVVLDGAYALLGGGCASRRTILKHAKRLGLR
jgi:hypothetical protein